MSEATRMLWLHGRCAGDGDRRACRPAWACALMAGLLLVIRSGHALDEEGLALVAQGQVAHEDNVYRVAEGLDAGALIPGASDRDWIYAVGAGFDGDWMLSRQRVRANALLTKYDYQDNAVLDYTGYQFDGRWDWVAGSAWSGEMTLGADRYRNKYTTGRVAQVPSLVETVNSAWIARYRVDTAWDVRVGTDGSVHRYQANELENGDVNAIGVQTGVGYRTRKDNRIEGSVSRRYGRWPNRAAQFLAAYGDQYTVTRYAALFEWRVAGSHTLTGDLGYSSWKNEEVPVRDVDGFNGTLRHDWAIGARVLSRLDVFRRLGPTEDPLAVYVETTGVEWSPSYQPGDKLRLSLGLRWREEEHLGQSLIASPDRREDRIYSAGLGAEYQVTRKLTLLLDGREERRNSNFPFADYSDFTSTLTARFEF